MSHSKRAFRKTVIFVIFLVMLMILSFFVSEYEYKQVNLKYQEAVSKDQAQTSPSRMKTITLEPVRGAHSDPLSFDINHFLKQS